MNVVSRTHYLPAFSRLGAYPREHLEEEAWGKKKSLFEYWGHEASLMPIEMQPLFRWRMEEARSGEAGWTGLVNFARERRDYIDGVLEEIEKRGPVTGGDFAEGPRGAWLVVVEQWQAGAGMAVLVRLHHHQDAARVRAGLRPDRAGDPPRGAGAADAVAG